MWATFVPEGVIEEVQRLGGDLLLRRREPAHHAVDVGSRTTSVAPPIRRSVARRSVCDPAPSSRFHSASITSWRYGVSTPRRRRGRAGRAPRGGAAALGGQREAPRRDLRHHALGQPGLEGHRRLALRERGVVLLHRAPDRGQAASPERWSSRSRFPSRSPTRPL